MRRHGRGEEERRERREEKIPSDKSSFLPEAPQRDLTEDDPRPTTSSIPSAATVM